jgi:hypothetical protein
MMQQQQPPTANNASEKINMTNTNKRQFTQSDLAIVTVQSEPRLLLDRMRL